MQPDPLIRAKPASFFSAHALDKLGQRLCRSQSILNSGQVQRFSIFGTFLILAIGGVDYHDKFNDGVYYWRHEA